MSEIQKISRAEIITSSANRTIHIIDYGNPEKEIAKILKEYIEEMGFSSMFPNFSHIRIGTVHPFALLLAQEVFGSKQNLNVFPSIIISNSSDRETLLTLGREKISVLIGRSDVNTFEGYASSGDIFISDEALSRLKDATENNVKVAGYKRIGSFGSTFDFNIWTDNKEITSFIYDLVCQFILEKRDVLSEKGIDFQEDTSGTRSGDVNLDFGKILYGANMRALGTRHMTSMSIDIPEGVEITKVSPEPTYHYLED